MGEIEVIKTRMNVLEEMYTRLLKRLEKNASKIDRLYIAIVVSSGAIIASLITLSITLLL